LNLGFQNIDSQAPKRNLRLYVSDAALDPMSAPPDYAISLFNLVSDWLSNPDVIKGEVEYFN
jgi:hypothetical protein